LTADPLESSETGEQNPPAAELAPLPLPAADAAAALYEEAGAERFATVGALVEPTGTGDPDVSEAIAELASTLPQEPLGEAVPTTGPRHRFWFRRSPARAKVKPSRKRRFLGFAVAFVLSALFGLFLVSAVAIGFSASYANRILPGVHVGSVDLSGLTRDQAIAKLQSDFSYLGKGEVTVTTPVGAATITYQQIRRGPDVEVMADAAMAVGHSGWLIPDAASMVHSAYYGQAMPIVVRLDPTALAERLRQLVGTSSIAPQNASVATNGSTFNVMPASVGNGLDEKTIGSAILDQLSQPSAPADLQAGEAFVTVAPQVTEQDVQGAVARANKMIVDVPVTWATKPDSAPASWKPSTWTITAKQIRDWIIFGVRQDGTYSAAVDPSRIQAYLASATANVWVAPVEPTVVFDPTGKPVSLVAGQDGVAVDAGATASAVAAHLDALAADVLTGSSVEVVTTPLHPQIVNVDSVAGMVLIGGHTTVFYPDISNGMGKNIRQPAKNLDGKVIGPGQQFSFLAAVGPIDEAHGFAMGGVILHGQSDHTGAMGGGICSASTTMFNAAANAGLQIDERHPHFYYISRYPVGRDATVYANGQTTWDLKWTNDTPYPIVIRAWTTPGSKSTITFQLWSWPTNRTVTWTGGAQTDKIKAVENPPKYTNALPVGQTARAEYATDGFKTVVERVVKDSAGAVLHDDVWGSSYAVVNGQLMIGGNPPATPTPVPTPTP
jgi:vancomycin resistance protein YoaR